MGCKEADVVRLARPEGISQPAPPQLKVLKKLDCWIWIHYLLYVNEMDNFYE